MTLRFDGDAVDAGAMDVRQLAPALVAAADLIEEAHFLLRIPGPSPRVELRTTRSGSFIADLAVLLTSSPVTAAVNVAGLVSAVTSTFGLVKKLAHRKIASTHPVRPGLIRVITQDGITVETSPESLDLVLSAFYCRTMRRVVEPLADDGGIHSMTVGADGQSETMTASDLPSFGSALAADDDIHSELDRLRTVRPGDEPAERGGPAAWSAGSSPLVVPPPDSEVFNLWQKTSGASSDQETGHKTEDPGEALDNSYQRQLDVLTKVRRGLADVATSRKHVELQMNQLQQHLHKLEDQQRQASAEGREDLAREAQARQSDVQGRLNELQTQYASLQAEEEKLTIDSQRFQAQVDAFRTHKETLEAAYTAAEARARIGEALAGISEEMRDADIVIRRARDKTMQAEARAGAIDELLASGALDRVISPGQRDDIQAELDEMQRPKGDTNEPASAPNEDAPESASQASTGQAMPTLESPAAEQDP